MPTAAQLRKLHALDPTMFDLDEVLPLIEPKKKGQSGTTLEQGSFPKKSSTSSWRTCEAVLQMVHQPKTMMTKMCNQCHLNFATNYVGVAYCSDSCRVAAAAAIGLVYDPKAKSEEQRWGGEPPNVVSAETYATLVEFAKKILELDSPQSSPPPRQNRFSNF